jgi:hypothetical protein
MQEKPPILSYSKPTTSASGEWHKVLSLLFGILAGLFALSMLHHTVSEVIYVWEHHDATDWKGMVGAVLIVLVSAFASARWCRAAFKRPPDHG